MLRTAAVLPFLLALSGCYAPPSSVRQAPPPVDRQAAGESPEDHLGEREALLVAGYGASPEPNWDARPEEVAAAKAHIDDAFRCGLIRGLSRTNLLARVYVNGCTTEVQLAERFGRDLRRFVRDAYLAAFGVKDAGRGGTELWLYGSDGSVLRTDNGDFLRQSPGDLGG